MVKKLLMALACMLMLGGTEISANTQSSQYMSDDPEPLTVGATGVIKIPQWAVYNNN